MKKLGICFLLSLLSISSITRAMDIEIAMQMLPEQLNQTLYDVVRYNNDIDEVQMLLAAGANVNYQDHAQDTPLRWAVSRNNIEMVQVLLAAGANPNIANYHGATPLYLAVRGLKSFPIVQAMVAQSRNNLENEIEPILNEQNVKNVLVAARYAIQLPDNNIELDLEKYASNQISDNERDIINELWNYIHSVILM